MSGTETPQNVQTIWAMTNSVEAIDVFVDQLALGNVSLFTDIVVSDVSEYNQSVRGSTRGLL